jgi:DNA-binding CsgD family transcriptional regulator
MSGSQARERSRRRILRICDSSVDGRTLRVELLAELGRQVPFDAYAWLLTDPETSVGSSPLADIPCLPELPRLIRLKYLTEVNRWTRLRSSVACLADVTAGDLSQSLVWRDLLHRYQIVDVASVVFRDAYGCWGFLDLWRGPTSVPFTSAEAAYLADIAGPITRALRSSQAGTFTQRASPDRPGRGPVVLVLSPDLDVIAQTAETEAYLRALVPPDVDHSPVPASAYNVAAQLLATEAGIDANTARARVHLVDGQWLTLRAARIGTGGPLDARDIAVTIEDSSPSERAGMFARSHGLSNRESALLDHLIRGADTHQLARLMFLSEHTVQDHLKSIFAKTSVHNRRTLLARALGG